MLLVDRHPLEQEALNDKNHNLHNFAKLVDETLTYLTEHYKDGAIRFKKIGYPKYTKGADSAFRELPKVKEPDTQWRIPLKAYVAIGDLGKHTWMCCLDPPEVLANGLHDMPKFSKRKGQTIEETLVVNIAQQPDLAFFLYKISPFMERPGHNGLFRIIDPVRDDEELGAKAIAETRRKYAVWNMLQDTEKLRRMAKAYDVDDVTNKQPNAIRQELEDMLTKNDELQKNNPAIRGTKEFEEEMQVTDSLLLRAFIKTMLDAKRLEYKGDGWYRIGSKMIAQVPFDRLSTKLDWLCSYLMSPSNVAKQQEFMRDVLSKEYLENIKDRKEWEWLSKIADFNPAFKKTEDIKEKVTTFFCPI